MVYRWMELYDWRIKMCDICQHRIDSINRCTEYLNLGMTGMICDPTPKSECKWHTLYGEKLNFNKIKCFDYKPISNVSS